MLFTHGGLGKLKEADLEGTPEQILHRLQEQNIRSLHEKVFEEGKYPLQHDKSKPRDEVLEKLEVKYVFVGQVAGPHVRQAAPNWIRVDSSISRAFGAYENEHQRGSYL